MDAKTLLLRDKAEKGRILYRSNKISRNEACGYVEPYLNAVNDKAILIAKKYNMKPKRVSFKSFVR